MTMLHSNPAGRHDHVPSKPYNKHKPADMSWSDVKVLYSDDAAHVAPAFSKPDTSHKATRIDRGNYFGRDVEKKPKHIDSTLSTKDMLYNTLYNGVDIEELSVLPVAGSIGKTATINPFEPGRPHPVRRMKKSGKAKNGKTNRVYRPWQELQHNQGVPQKLLTKAEKIEALYDELYDDEEPTSPLGKALEKNPTRIWDKSKDQQKAA